MAKTPILLFVLLFLVLQGCSGLAGTRAWVDFSQFQDLKMDGEVALWLEGGEQSAVTDRIVAEAKSLSGANRRERLFRAMAHIWTTFSYDPWLNAEAFRRTAEELFTSRVLGGCSDFALVEITLFRALGIPSRMVITANVDWMHCRPTDPLAMSEGHSFIEVFLEGKWYLVDTTYRYLFSGYDPESASYPHGEYFCRRGKDFWDMGIRNLQDAEETIRQTAADYREDFQEPGYSKHPL